MDENAGHDLEAERLLGQALIKDTPDIAQDLHLRSQTWSMSKLLAFVQQTRERNGDTRRFSQILVLAIVCGDESGDSKEEVDDLRLLLAETEKKSRRLPMLVLPEMRRVSLNSPPRRVLVGEGCKDLDFRRIYSPSDEGVLGMESTVEEVAKRPVFLAAGVAAGDLRFRRLEVGVLDNASAEAGGRVGGKREATAIVKVVLEMEDGSGELTKAYAGSRVDAIRAWQVVDNHDERLKDVLELAKAELRSVISEQMLTRPWSNEGRKQDRSVRVRDAVTDGFGGRELRKRLQDRATAVVEAVRACSK